MYAIEAHQVGKKYRIASQREQLPNLNEALLNLLAQPWRRVNATLQGNPSPASDRDFWALRHATFNIPAGETFGIIGVNGSGKSTLMKMIGNVVRPTEGYIKTRGRVGALLEVNAGFHPELTGRENTYLKGAAMGMSRTEVRQRFDEIVEFAEIADFIDTPIKRYSSGMSVRLGFAIAAKMRPEIFLVDEAFAVGDRAFQEKCLRELEAIISEGCTVLVVSHIMSHITRLCKTALWLHQGKVVEQGEVGLVTDRYINRTMSPGAGTARGYFKTIPDPSKPMSISEVSLLDSAGALTTRVDITERFTIRVVYHVHREEMGHLCAFIGSHEEGGRALFISDADMDERLRGYRKPGTYTAELEIPAWTLNEGDYSLTVSTEIPYGEIYQRQNNIIEFSITDRASSRRHSWYRQGRRPGVMGLDLPWHYVGEEPV